MRNRYIIAGLAGALLLVGCGSAGSISPGVPALSQPAGYTSAGSPSQGSPSQGSPSQGSQSQGSPSQGASAQAVSAQGAWTGRGAELHAAAQCIRQHGIPSYQDPVLTASGEVYTDSRSLDDAPPPVIDAVQQACGTLAARAGLSPDAEPPAPPQLVEAGVRSAECMRAHGLPNVQDPTAQSSYTPGHGFGYSAGEIPADGKADPVYQAAAHACRALLDAEIRASTLASLGNDG